MWLELESEYNLRPQSLVVSLGIIFSIQVNIFNGTNDILSEGVVYASFPAFETAVIFTQVVSEGSAPTISNNSGSSQVIVTSIYAPRTSFSSFSAFVVYSCEPAIIFTFSVFNVTLQVSSFNSYILVECIVSSDSPNVIIYFFISTSQIMIFIYVNIQSFSTQLANFAS